MIRLYVFHIGGSKPHIEGVMTVNKERFLKMNPNGHLPDVDTTTASEIQSKPITWMWKPYIPVGAVTILIGDGGEGKSFYSLALASAISNGLALPGMDSAYPASDVIIQNAENPWPTVIKPRLEMLGANCDRIHYINDSSRRLTLTDERIEAAIIKHNAKLIIIDPFQSWLPENFSMNRSESVRPALTRLARVAERTKSAILLVGHISKGRGKAQHRGLGSVDIVNSVPSVLYLGRAEGLERDVRVVAHGKSNFDEQGAAQMFRLNKAGGFTWLGENEDITPDDIINFNAAKAREDKSKVEEAVDFLEELLSDGDISTAEALEMADELGISRRTLERARKAANVKSIRVDGQWIMTMGEDY